jgi:hypothetical protein
MVDRGGTAAATASARALALGLGRMGCHGLLMGKEASRLGNASGECATPTESSTDPGPRRSQLPPLASNGTADVLNGPCRQCLYCPRRPLSRLVLGRLPTELPTSRALWPLLRGSDSLAEGLLRLVYPSPS